MNSNDLKKIATDVNLDKEIYGMSNVKNENNNILLQEQ